MHAETSPTPAATSLISTALAITPAAVGCAAGLLLADRLRPRTRQSLAGALLTAGALATLPVLIDFTAKRLNSPSSRRGSDRRLESIRGGHVDHDYADEIVGSEVVLVA